MAAEKVGYVYKVDGKELESKVPLKGLTIVYDLREAIWNKSSATFQRFEGITGDEHLSLWKEGDVKSLTLNSRLFGGDDSVFKVDDEDKKVFVTPVGADRSDDAFVISAKDSFEIWNAGFTPASSASTRVGPAVGLDKLTFETGINSMINTVNRLTNTVSNVSTVVGMLLKIHMETWKESTPSRTADGGTWKKSLIDAYGESDQNHDLMCMATGIRLPYKNVIAAHIVGKKLGAESRIILDIGVDDVRNGVLWCTPIEEAWTNNKLCFSWSVMENNYTVLVLDDKLQNTRVGTYGKALTGKALQTVSHCLGDLTFGQLHGTNMTFLNDCRPYKRSFSLMSVMKKQWALEAGSKPMFSDANYDLDYWSAGAYQDKVMAWLETHGADLVNPEAPSEESGSGRSNVG